MRLVRISCGGLAETMADLLFLCHRIPYPPDKGDKIRAWNFLEHLGRRFDVHLGCFVDDPADLAHVPALERRVARLAAVPLDKAAAQRRALLGLRPGAPLTESYYRDRRLARFVEETVRHHRPAMIFAFSAAMAQYAARVPDAPRVLDMVDVDSEKFAAYAASSSLPGRLVWAREARTLLRFERRAVAAFDRTLLVSESEEARFLALAPEARGKTGWIANGVDADRFSPRHRFETPFTPGPQAGPVVVFTGAMDYRPNIEACLWFADHVLPALRAQAEGARFCIVGANPAPSLLQLAREAPGVDVTGRVADTRPYLAHADVVVAPLAIGRGIQNKVLEAMAMARPVVATSAAFIGIDAVPGRDLLVADDAGAMATAILAVHRGACPGLGAAAREAVRTRHAWSQAFIRLDSVLAEAEGQVRGEAAMIGAAA